MAPEDSYLSSARTTLREPYPDEPCGAGQVRDLDNISSRLEITCGRIAKLAGRAEEDATRISGAIPCGISKDSVRDEPSSVVGRINAQLDNIESWLNRLDDATGRFSRL